MKLLTLLCISLLLSGSCSLWRITSPEPVDLPQIIERESLRVITMVSPVSYFIYSGEPMGYEFELVRRFSQRIGVPVELVIADSIEQMYELLEAGQGDLIAYRLTSTADGRERVAFTVPVRSTHQVLVQRIPELQNTLQPQMNDHELVRNPVQLDGKKVYVAGGTAYAERLRNLSGETGADITVIEPDRTLSTERLIELVATGSIDYTVADQDLAVQFAGLHSQIDVNTPLSVTRQVSWATRLDSPKLLDALDSWLEAEQDETDFFVLHRKYFIDHRSFRMRMESPYLVTGGGTLSPYDELLQSEAQRIGWDWRLLAALVHTESRFNPRARSWMGAIGLMQLMPATARYFGASDPFDPKQNIGAGVSFLEWLQVYWGERIDDPDQRLLFVIASYNVGQGHVEDARRLASLHEADPNVWNASVADYLLAKSDPRYYNHEVVQFGFARGQEPVAFVQRILGLTRHYQRFIN